MNLLQIYVTTTVVRNFGIIHSVFAISQLIKLVYNRSVGTLVKFSINFVHMYMYMSSGLKKATTPTQYEPETQL